MKNIKVAHPEAVGFYGLSRDNYIASMIAIEKANLDRPAYLYDTLTDEQKNDFVEINGRKYVRAVAEANGLI